MLGSYHGNWGTLTCCEVHLLLKSECKASVNTSQNVPHVESCLERGITCSSGLCFPNSICVCKSCLLFIYFIEVIRSYVLFLFVIKVLGLKMQHLVWAFCIKLNSKCTLWNLLTSNLLKGWGWSSVFFPQNNKTYLPSFCPDNYPFFLFDSNQYMHY